MSSMTRKAHKNGLDLSAIRERLAQNEGRDYWRSLNELADTEAFRNYLHREFPEGASEWGDKVGRRKFLQVMGASLAFAGLTSCTRQPPEKIVPYVRAPEQLIPGKTPVFRFGPVSRRIRARRVGRKPCGATDQDRGQPDPSGDPQRGRCDFWACGCDNASADTRSLRSGPHAGARGKWAREHMGAVFRRACDRGGEIRFGSGCGIALVDGNRDLARVDRPDSIALGQIIPMPEMAPI